MNNNNALFSLLMRYFPHVLTQNWEITPLAGLSGGTYLLQTRCAHQRISLIARADGQTQSSLYVDRDKEARILKQLEQFPYAPKLIGRNNHWLLLTWCVGQNPHYTTFVSPEFQAKLANIVAQLHCHPLLNYRLQLRNEIAHYGALIDKKRLSPRWKKIHHQFLTMKMPKTLKLAPAHMDIHSGNVVSNSDGKIMLLDWEYAANTDIAFSLETYFQFNELTLNQQDFFLHHYCDVSGAYSDKIRLAKHCHLWTPWVKYMMLMWYEVQWNESHQPQFLLQSHSLRQYFNLLG
ncbi:phosphotransferase [Providencia sp. Je.9.19]|uniref:phosphotransferase n=1 Tax=Providencia sp. Je.9.19 TaxID=3142844 RepID=UPI003DA7E270